MSNYIAEPNIMYQLQFYFRTNILPTLPNDEAVWRDEFAQWLKSQGARIHQSNDQILRNSLGIAPFYDGLEFDDAAQYTMFILRWS